MESYAVVDNNVRRKMEEMLKTWKDPVPGSMDTRPVFSHELVRPIENALMKARAATMPQPGAIPGRPRSAMIPHRNTPTPPGMRGQPGGPVGPYPAQQYGYPNGGRPGEAPYPGQQQQVSSLLAPFHTKDFNADCAPSSSSPAPQLLNHMALYRPLSNRSSPDHMGLQGRGHWLE